MKTKIIILILCFLAVAYIEDPKDYVLNTAQANECINVPLPDGTSHTCCYNSKRTLECGGDSGKTIYNKPYILILEKVTADDKALCTADENCMDVMDTSILPERREQ